MASFLAWSLSPHGRIRAGVFYAPTVLEYQGSIPAEVAADPYIVTATADDTGLQNLITDRLGIKIALTSDPVTPDVTGKITPTFPAGP